MAKLTWLGEDIGDVTGPSFTTAFGGTKFQKGKAVEVTDKAVIAKAQGNHFFEVELTAEEQREAEERAEKAAAVAKADEPALAPAKRGPGRPPKVKDGD